MNQNNSIPVGFRIWFQNTFFEVFVQSEYWNVHVFRIEIWSNLWGLRLIGTHRATVTFMARHWYLLPSPATSSVENVLFCRKAASWSCWLPLPIWGGCVQHTESRPSLWKTCHFLVACMWRYIYTCILQYKSVQVKATIMVVNFDSHSTMYVWVTPTYSFWQNIKVCHTAMAMPPNGNLKPSQLNIVIEHVWAPQKCQFIEEKSNKKTKKGKKLTRQ